MGEKRAWVSGMVVAVGVALSGCGSDKPNGSAGGAGTAGNAAGGTAGVGGTTGADDDNDDVGGSSSRAGTGGSVSHAGSGGSAGSGGKAPHVPLTLGVAAPRTGSFTDERDQTKYGWVELNGVKWMSENLKLVLSEQDLQTCYGDLSVVSAPEDCSVAGYFYGWSAAMAQPRIANSLTLDVADGTYQGVCPAGWHLPTQTEWIALLDYVSGLAHAEPPDSAFAAVYDGISDPLLAAMGWKGGYGTNELGFDAQPFGEHDLGYKTSFWGSDETGRQSAVIVDVAGAQISVESDFKVYRNAVRCVEGEASKPAPVAAGPALTHTTGTFTDPRDQKSYATVTIGDQEWFAQNLELVPATGDSLCYAQQDAHCRIFGRLYGYDTAQDVCPSGWHIPSVDEWHTLFTYVDDHADKVGAAEVDGTFEWKMGKPLLAPWEVWQFGPTEPPSFGFNGLPGGFALDGRQSGGLED
ncbi:MAG TPA: FISUMP domain-containing protein, partial [Polyangiaceae bacterium]|nr:FISUMP domain-containing protein [Polyangiaceae bacterium]